MPGKGHASSDRIREMRKQLEESESGVRMLPVVTYEHKKWFFDERLRQIRNIRNPHEWIDLNEFEMDYFKRKARAKIP